MKMVCKTSGGDRREEILSLQWDAVHLDTLTEIDEKLWLTVIDTVPVHADGRMTFQFRGGAEIGAYALRDCEILRQTKTSSHGLTLRKTSCTMLYRNSEGELFRETTAGQETD